VPAPGVLANDYDDAEFDAPHVHDRVGGPDHGELTLNRDGSFIYTPDPDFTGVDGFTYRPADSSVGNVTFVTIEVWPAEES
jgi:VCBS repeat-containing protein